MVVALGGPAGRRVRAFVAPAAAILPTPRKNSTVTDPNVVNPVNTVSNVAFAVPVACVFKLVRSSARFLSIFFICFYSFTIFIFNL